jgi:hypothetical protein
MVARCPASTSMSPFFPAGVRFVFVMGGVESRGIQRRADSDSILEGRAREPVDSEATTADRRTTPFWLRSRNARATFLRLLPSSVIDRNTDCACLPFRSKLRKGDRHGLGRG